MMMLELVLSKPPSDWTDEEWELVRDAIKEGAVTIDRLNEDFCPIKARDSKVIPLKSFDFAQVQWEQPCNIVEFFTRNPDAKVAMIACSCPKCTVQCAVG